MKKYLYFAAAAVVMVSACKKSNDFSQSSPLHEVDGTKVPIELSSNVSVQATKGAGAVNEWAEQTLYIFGFQRAKYTDDAPADFSDPDLCLINGVKAFAPKKGESPVMAGAIDLYDRKTETDEEGEKNWGYPFYYGLSEEGAYATYDFYGCYLDDANQGLEGNPNSIAGLVTYTETEVTIPFTIDGTQDLMTAYADRKKDCKTNTAAEGQEPVYAFKGNVTDINQAYSGWTARQGVTPNLVFEHALTQFEFQVRNKSGEAGEDLYLQKLEFDTYTTGDLVIAAKDVTTMGVTNLGGYDNVSINYIEDETDPDDHGKELPKGHVIGDTNFEECGSLIVTPQASDVDGEVYKHTVKLTVAQHAMKDLLDEDGKPELDDQGHKIQEPVYQEMKPLSFAVTPEMVMEGQTHTDGEQSRGLTEFEKGYRYVVYISIYSWEKIEISVELKEWLPGGHIDIDPDDHPEFIGGDQQEGGEEGQN